MDALLFHKLVWTAITLSGAIAALFFAKAVIGRDDDFDFQINIHRFIIAIAATFAICILGILSEIWLN